MNDVTTIPLQCGHELLMATPWPHIGELLWCIRCVAYHPTGPVEVRTMTQHYDEWRCTPLGSSRYKGECNDDGCAFTKTERNFYRLRNIMEEHYMDVHIGTTRTLIAQAAKVNIPKRGVPPPY